MTHAIHDFTRKLCGEKAQPTLASYVEWRRAIQEGDPADAPSIPPQAPISINLDLTTACNFRCTHCIDWDVLNGRERHVDRELLDSLSAMSERGLASVILIGGGEPSLHPMFDEVVRFIKRDLGLALAIVSNGSRPDRLIQAASEMKKGDWIRLSLDAGSNDLFRAMHRPNDPNLTLDKICSSVKDMRAAGPDVTLGFSFVVTWEGASRDDETILENVDEIFSAAQRAKQSGFHYIGYKPVLGRTEEGAEVMDPTSMAAQTQAVAQRIRSEVNRARELEDDTFSIYESINLSLLEEGNWEEATRQPKTCHMQALRQVLSPMGVYNCPAHRGVEKARIGPANAWATDESRAQTGAATEKLIETFDASVECASVTCLYHSVNWWIEGLVQDPSLPIPDALEAGDPFL